MYLYLLCLVFNLPIKNHNFYAIQIKIKNSVNHDLKDLVKLC